MYKQIFPIYIIYLCAIKVNENYITPFYNKNEFNGFERSEISNEFNEK